MIEEFKIYTGCFAKAKQYESKGLIAVSIARYPPKWFSVLLSYPELAPQAGMQEMAENQFRKKYLGVLRYMNPMKVVNDLKRMFGGSPVVLCCHEKPDEFCHRHIVASWLSKATGFEVAEYGINPTKSKEESPVCGSLF